MIMSKKVLKNDFFKNINFIKLWLASLFSTFGDSIDDIIIMLLVIELTNSARTTGIFLMIISIPGVIFSVFGGAFSDAFEKKKIMIIMASLQGVIMIILMFLTAIGNISFYILCFFLFLLESCSKLYMPSFTALSAYIIKNESYSKFRSFMTTTQSLISLIAPSICTSMIILVGYSLPLLINSLSYFVTSFFVSMIHIDDNINNDKQIKTIKAKIRTIIDSIKEGFGYIIQKKSLIKLISIMSIMNFCLAMFDVALPFYVRDYLNLSTQYYGYLKSFSIFAFILAGVLLSKIKFEKTIRIIITSVFLMGVCVMILGICNNFLIVSIFWALGAFFRTIAIILIGSNIVTMSNKSYVGRISGISTMIMSIILMISRGLSGFLVESFSPEIIFSASGIIFLICSIIYRMDVKFYSESLR